MNRRVVVQPGKIGSRPGRIDRIVSMGCLDASGRRKLAERILGDWPEWIDDICKAGNEDTPAQFQERSGRLALQLHYSNDAEFPLESQTPAEWSDVVTS